MSVSTRRQASWRKHETPTLVHLGLAGLKLAGCATSKPVAVRHELDRERSKITTDGQAVAGYIDGNGLRHSMRAKVCAVGRDSLEFTLQKTTMYRLERPVPDVRVRVHRDDVQTLLVERIDPVRSTLTVVAVSGAAYLAFMAGAAASVCPLCGFSGWGQ